jgi:predicted metal-dependent TIM-barrel fold hydrolase
LALAAKRNSLRQLQLAVARGLPFRCAHDRAIPMTLRIETASDGTTITVRLIGRIATEHLSELEAQVHRQQLRLALDLEEVTLVDLDIVQFLIACEGRGIELRNCAPYIRAWMNGERNRE